MIWKAIVCYHKESQGHDFDYISSCDLLLHYMITKEQISKSSHIT